MVVVRFSALFDKIRSGEKKQTIRPYENYSYLTHGDLIHCYSTKKVEGIRRPVVDEMLYLGTVTSVRLAFWYDIRFNDKIAKLDGFENSKELERWFKRRYGEISPHRKFRIIRWK